MNIRRWLWRAWRFAWERHSRAMLRKPAVGAEWANRRRPPMRHQRLTPLRRWTGACPPISPWPQAHGSVSAVNEPLSSDHNVSGDTFTATLTQPLIANGYVVARRGQPWPAA